MSDPSRSNTQPEGEPPRQPAPAEPRAWSNPPIDMPTESAPSISNLIEGYVQANDLTNDKGFRDVILCPPENTPELAARTSKEYQTAQRKPEGKANTREKGAAAAETPGGPAAQQETPDDAKHNPRPHLN